MLIHYWLSFFAYNIIIVPAGDSPGESPSLPPQAQGQDGQASLQPHQ